MRTFLIRGVMITFFAVTGLFGSAATVQLAGVDANTASASFTPICVYKPYLSTPVNPDCYKWVDDGGIIP